ncbi:uncharacterized protein LOC115324609 [Ixodes scapularis]|uniref:uncharacterized protein LOC115324609 n=1 Tax=Ixodes scapularis TaxID=6945 RepID=UPI001A9FCFFC|nr:uncharacterized protein LOC115324609 [Ixodes scapularis]
MALTSGGKLGVSNPVGVGNFVPVGISGTISVVLMGVTCGGTLGIISVCTDETGVSVSIEVNPVELGISNPVDMGNFVPVGISGTVSIVLVGVMCGGTLGSVPEIIHYIGN